jgi:ABC-type uncharacterized transport system substrate-binding protein
MERHPTPTGSELLRRMVHLGAAVVALALSSIAAPLAVDAQQPQRLYRIGILDRTTPKISAPNLNAFRQGLRELGYVEGKDFAIEYRSVDGQDERYPHLAAELVRLKVDLILTRGTPAALAAKNATESIPVIMTSIGDPVGQGVVASLARPGGNVTGLTAVATELYPKRSSYSGNWSREPYESRPCSI